MSARRANSPSAAAIRSAAGPGPSSAAAIPSTSGALSDRNTSATRFAFEGKCRYTVPAATSALPAMASISAAAYPPSRTSARAASRMRSRTSAWRRRVYSEGR